MNLPDAAVCSAAFALVAWLLFLSFMLGRYAARVDALDRAQQAVFERLDSIAVKIDGIALSSIHRCIQVERIAKLEANCSEPGGESRRVIRFPNP